ncbi:MAG: hypothetical protein J6T05_01520 [Prevotella sp.]|nr:hypothetical protein [Prevotella sp.]
MKHHIFFFSLLCSLMVACTTDKKSPTGNPIENLVAYLAEQNVSQTHAELVYEGGEVLKTSKRFWMLASTPHSVEKLQKEGKYHGDLKANTQNLQMIDSCLSAFRWGCSAASHCYHKENHVKGNDSIIYALAFEPLDGEEIALQDDDSHIVMGANYKAAKAATLRYTGDERYSMVGVEYVNREAKGKKDAFDERPLKDFVKWVKEKIAGVKVYETSYEYTFEDFMTNPALVIGCPVEDLRPYDGKTTGHLYVVPKAHAQEVFDALKSKVEKCYVREHPNQEFYLKINNVNEVIVGKLEDINYRAPQPYYPKELRGKLSVDGHFYILVLDQTVGAYAIPNDWHHTIRVKDHKATLLPNAHKPNKEGWID